MRGFVENGQGTLRTNLAGRLAYQSFCPTPLERLALPSLDAEGVRLLSLCSRKIGEIGGMIRFVPNASMYLTMYVRKEALLSAQIEGTQCTFDDVLDPDNPVAIHKDVADVIRYVDATNYAMDRMKELPLCMRLLKEVHERLIADGRGSERRPGEIRSSQNWIGPAGCTIATSSFVPPNVEDMQEALGHLERFMNDDSDYDPIIKAALIHYQFETIHPFLDGNGRLGRLLIVLSLLNDGVLDKPLFYPSYQFKINRSDYYNCMMNIRLHGDYIGWITFFCRCLHASAVDAAESLQSLVGLHERDVRAVHQRFIRGSANALALLDVLEGHPIVDVGFVAKRVGVSRTSAAKIVNEFCELGILRPRDVTRQRYREYLYEDYLAILRAGGEPLG